MPTDPRRLLPGELCRLLNSTALGEVINVRQLYRHRNRAGYRVGEGRHVDLLRYVAWLLQRRHAPKPAANPPSEARTALSEVAQGAAGLASARRGKEALDRKQQQLIAALLTEPSHLAAAAQAGVSRATLYRWMQDPEFRAAYRQARREVVEASVGRMQAAMGQAIEALLKIVRDGRDSDRIRAAQTLLEHSLRGLSEADTLHGPAHDRKAARLDTADVVQLVSQRLQQIEQADLPTTQKSRLTATLSDALLRAIGVDVLNKRLIALEEVLVNRKEQQK